MGAAPDAVRREIEEQRERITPRVRKLGGRLQDDARDTQAVVGRRASQAMNIANRTFAFLGGGFIVGFALGVIIQDRRKDRERDKLLQESVQNWPWRSAWMGRPAPPKPPSSAGTLSLIAKTGLQLVKLQRRARKLGP